MGASSHTVAGLQVTFDDPRGVANAGLVLPATLVEQLDVEGLIDAGLDLGDAVGAANAGRKALTAVFAMLAGGDCIDDAELLRSGATDRVLPFEAAASSTVGTFLRSFSWGHVRQFEKVAGELLGRAWQAGAGPGDQPMTIDLDSTICEVYGHTKEGAAYGHTRTLGYHPLMATRADTDEVIATRLRGGNANEMRGSGSFVREVIGRARRAGATGPLTVRADSGFYGKHVIAACCDHDVRYSITIKLWPFVRAAIDKIPHDAWQPLHDYRGGIAQVAETTLKGQRLIVRRVRNRDRRDPQQRLFTVWDYHAFVTDRAGDIVTLDADHRRHATVELAIRDLKAGGLAHLPSARFNANAAWLLLATLAHNLARWTTQLGLDRPARITLKTLRTRLLALPGRLTRSARQLQLHLPTRWPWAATFLTILQRLRALPRPA